MRSTALLLISLLILLLTGATTSQARQPVRAKQGMVVAQEPHAAEVGLRVLRSGGNAADAAIAVAMALAVTLPSAGNIGGGGFLVLRKADGSTAFVDFRERAPLRAARTCTSAKTQADARQPGRMAGAWNSRTVRGMELVHQKFGTSRGRSCCSPRWIWRKMDIRFRGNLRDRWNRPDERRPIHKGLIHKTPRR